MQTFNTLLNTKSAIPFHKMADTNQVPWLVSQYMQMFDVSKVDSALLGKRERQTLDDYHQEDLLKKFKPTVTTSEWKPPILDLALNPMTFLSCSSYSFPNFLTSSKRAPESTDVLKPGSVMKSDKIQNKKGEKLIIKQEYVKQEEVPRTQKALNSKISNTNFDQQSVDSMVMTENLSEAPQKMIKIKTPLLSEEEPTLAEFTKNFPDWDLATIFSFIRSGKPRSAFEKEKSFRTERKLKNKIQREGKTANSKQKQIKTKKRLDSNDEYKPPRALKKVIAPLIENDSIQMNKSHVSECKEEHL